jgi:hypothetical protein
VSFEPEHKIILAQTAGEHKQYMADEIVEKTKARLNPDCIPMFFSDGLVFYTNALLKYFGFEKKYEPTGKRGRPRLSRYNPLPGLRYGQVVKERKKGTIVKVDRWTVFGEPFEPKQISTSMIERENLTLRQENHRLSRKTLGFSKDYSCLDQQMVFYSAYSNYCRKHRALWYLDELGHKRLNSPMKSIGITDHVWSLRTLLTFPFHITSTI